MADRLVARIRKRLSPSFALDADVSLPPDGAPVTVLLGPSGGGKTTVLRCLAGLSRPDGGTIRFGETAWFDGERGVDLPPQKRRVGFVFQDYALFPHLSAEDNVAFGVKGPRGSRRGRARELLAMMELRGHESSRPGQLSGGERQRVALARALAIDPALLLLDEPLSALDGPTRETLRRELRGLLLRTGRPAIVVTHDREEALALGDRVAVLIDGRVHQAGPVDEVFTRPADQAVARTVGVETVVPGTILGASQGLVTVDVGGVHILAAEPPLSAPGNAVLVCIRAEEVALATSPPARGSARNHFAATVIGVAAEGGLVRVTVALGASFTLAALVTRPAVEDLGLVLGSPVTAIFKATSVHLVLHDRG